MGDAPRALPSGSAFLVLPAAAKAEGPTAFAVGATTAEATDLAFFAMPTAATAAYAELNGGVATAGAASACVFLASMLAADGIACETPLEAKWLRQRC